LLTQQQSDEPIDLGQERASFTVDNATYTAEARIRLRFAPTERLEIAFPFNNPLQLTQVWSQLVDPQTITLTLPNLGTKLSVFPVEIPAQPDVIVFMPDRSPVRVTDSTSNIISATFHLLNLPNFKGPCDYWLQTDAASNSFVRQGFVTLTAGHWKISIAALPTVHAATEHLKTYGGHILTHVGTIERIDRVAFTEQELENMLNCVQYFLSFALGRWAGVGLTVGFDDRAHPVFREWGIRRVAEGGRLAGSWFDIHHSELLPQVFPGFLSLWSNPTWQKPLRDVIYWFCTASNHRTGVGIDTGLILAQTALELLAWNHCVINKQLYTPAQFGSGHRNRRQQSLSAEAKIKELLNDLSIPVASYALAPRGQNVNVSITDTVQLIVKSRNALIHPDKRSFSPQTQDLIDAWNHGLWFIQMVLLKLCGHNGKYSNRLSQRNVGQVEPVPWAPAHPGATPAP
jgi:hypothetical protein